MTTSGPTSRPPYDESPGGAAPVPGRAGGRRLLLFGGIGALVLALVAGIAIWIGPGGGSGEGADAEASEEPAQPAEERKAFERAVAALATARGVRYTDTPNFADMEREITVTDFGHQFGTLTYPDLPNLDESVLRIGGNLYTRDHTDPTADPENPTPGPWAVGSLTGNESLRESLNQFYSPRLLAARLASALAEVPELPTPDTPDLPDLEVNGVPALRADTAAGTVLVAEEPPYRVLRLEPYDPTRLSDALKDADPEDLDELDVSVPRPDQDWGDSEGMDVHPLTGDEVTRMYDQLAQYVDQLTNAVDRGIEFTLESSGDLRCSSSGCAVDQQITGEVRPKAETRLAGGTVEAVLTAEITVDGRRAGRCSSDRKVFRLRGTTVTGTLTCTSASAGAVFARVDQEYRARARARGGGRYRFPYRADTVVEARALAVGEVKELRRLVELERDFEGCERSGDEPRNSFLSGTRVLLADGSTRPIERITPGTEVLTTDPATGRTSAQPVIDTITGTGERDLARLTIRGDGERGALTATDGHRFWDPARRSWDAAEELSTGDPLASPPDGATTGRSRDAVGSDAVRVVASRDEQRTVTVHNLTIANTHTYYVLAGDTPVLVHNDNQKGEVGKKKLIEILQSRGYEIVSYRGKPVEISIRSAIGVNVRPDVVARKNGKVFLFDSKNGPAASFTENQGRLGGYQSIETTGGTAYGGNARKVGLAGKRFGPTPVFIAGFGGYPFCGR